MIGCSFTLNLASLNADSHSLEEVRIGFRKSIIILVMLLVSCSSNKAKDDSADVVAAEESATTIAPVRTASTREKVGLGVPAALTALEGVTLRGEPFDPATLGQREVLLWFWAPW